MRFVLDEVIARCVIMNQLIASRMAVVTVMFASAPAGLAAETNRPNLIFFLSDDHRWDRMGCAGHPFLKTPTLDRLAETDVRFRNMAVTTSICAASRATILTGLYEFPHQFTFGTPPIDVQLIRASYPALLRNAGYRTGFIGKFGVRVMDGERERMFDTFVPIGRNHYLHTHKSLFEK